jgi:hypothetical protein
VGFILGIPVYTCKSVGEIHHVNKVKDKKAIISIDAEKAFNKF